MSNTYIALARCNGWNTLKLTYNLQLTTSFAWNVADRVVTAPVTTRNNQEHYAVKGRATLLTEWERTIKGVSTKKGQLLPYQAFPAAKGQPITSRGKLFAWFVTYRSVCTNVGKLSFTLVDFTRISLAAFYCCLLALLAANEIRVKTQGYLTNT